MARFVVAGAVMQHRTEIRPLAVLHFDDRRGEPAKSISQPFVLALTGAAADRLQKPMRGKLNTSAEAATSGKMHALLPDVQISLVEPGPRLQDRDALVRGDRLPL